MPQWYVSLQPLFHICTQRPPPALLQVDREAGDAGVLVTFNKNDSLGLQQQRQRLPIYKVCAAQICSACHIAPVCDAHTSLDYDPSMVCARRSGTKYCTCLKQELRSL